MAITISKNSGLNDDFWKPVAQIVTAVIKDADAEKNNYDEVVEKLYNVKKSSKYGEKITGITALPSFDVVGEGQRANLASINETSPKLIIHHTFAQTVTITKEMLEDAQYDDIKQISANLVKAYKRTRAQLATKALVGATSTSITFGGDTFDVSTPDGQALFSASHGSQSNIVTGASVTNANIFAYANTMANFETESGVVTGYEADLIIVPGNKPAVEQAARALAATDKVIGSDNNDVNIMKGRWTVIRLPFWQATNNDFILMSSQANKEMLASIFYDRTALDISDDIDIESRTLKYNGRGRMGVGHTNWRHVLLCQA